MSISSVLIGGAGVAGCAVAVALAQRGLDVTIVERARRWPDAGTLVAIPTDARAMIDATGVLSGGSAVADPFGPDGVSIARLRTAGVEVRAGIELVGFVAVDRHVEAELSDERIENYDAIVVVVEEGGAGDAWRVIASGDIQTLDAVASVTSALTALVPPS